MMKTLIMLAAGALSLTSSFAAAECVGSSQAENELIAREKSYEKVISGVFNQDPLSAMQYYATDRIQMFDAMPADQHGGLEVSTEAFKKHFKDIGPQYVGTMQFLDLRAHACGDIGFVTMIQHYFGKGSDGRKFDWNLRATDGFQKIGGQWKIIHEHLSFPIDMATEKAQMDSKF